MSKQKTTLLHDIVFTIVSCAFGMAWIYGVSLLFSCSPSYNATDSPRICRYCGEEAITVHAWKSDCRIALEKAKIAILKQIAENGTILTTPTE